MLGMPFQISLLFGSKAVAYPSEECPISQLYMGRDKLYEVYTKVIKVFTMLLVKGQNKLECLSLASLFSLVYGSRPSWSLPK